MFTVKRVAGSKEWESKFGPMVSYTVDLTGPDGKMVGGVEINQKPSTPAPSEGQSLEGRLEETKFGLKFKKENTGSFGGGSGGGNKTFKRDPRETEMIVRQTCLKAATELTVGLSPQSVEETQGLMGELFQFTLGLVHGVSGEVASVASNNQVVKENEPPLPPEPDVVSGNPSISIDELRRAYKEFREGNPDADSRWKQKLTAMGLTGETLEGASHDQRADLLAFLDAPPF